MKYAVYGANRVAKDFLYYFDKLEITMIFDDDIFSQYDMGMEIISIDLLGNYCNMYEQLIVCDFELDDKISKLEKMGLVYGKDYVKDRDFLEQLDPFQVNPDGKPVYVWGTGWLADRFLGQNKRFDIEGYIDSIKFNEVYRGKVVDKPSDIKEWKDIYVIVAIVDDKDIRDFLVAKGLKENIDFCNASSLKNSASGLLEKTLFDKSYYDLECSTMLNHAEVTPQGYIYCCCTTIADSVIGKLTSDTFDEIWKSNVHKALCLSNVNRTYSFCKKEMCPFFINKKREDIRDITCDWYYRKCKEHPGVVAVGYDSSCNLMCETCRDKMKICMGDEFEEVMKITDVVKKDILPYCDFFILAGDGEVFISKAYKELYASDAMNDVKYIRILSNGTLFNEKNWLSFRKNKSGKIMLTVSVDAASKDTYEKIRRGGNFDILKKNMEYAASLRKKGELAYFRMNFVVQKKNYQEIIPFIKWGLELGVDEVFFTKILNWGTYSDEEFKEISMMQEDGVTPKKELKEILDDPIVNNNIVDLGTIQYAHKEVELNTIENYYMWELERKVSNLFACSE